MLYADIAIEALKRASDARDSVDWNDRESLARKILQSSSKEEAVWEKVWNSVYFGGDSLRPYLIFEKQQMVNLVIKQTPLLQEPGIIGEIKSGKFGATEDVIHNHGANWKIFQLATSSELKRRLIVPNVYLLSLTNAARYQSRRYPLNISRLAQWLRFQHAARVRVSDLALSFLGDDELLAYDVATASPDVVGISVNFGELPSLRKIVSQIANITPRPVLCLGNVLAAWAPREVREICSDFETYISTSYGEAELEAVCHSVSKRIHENTIGSRPIITHRLEHLGPSTIVFPDEKLLEDTLSNRGQASIETSFGCQYGHCTFCPREHRGKGWRRPTVSDVGHVVSSMASFINRKSSPNAGVLSIVDEDGFGEEGRDATCETPAIVTLVRIAGSQNVSCEIYTRLEQLLDLRWSRSASVRRLQHLLEMRPFLSRVFVGVESGSNGQLRRYGKGQDIDDITAALRAGSLLGLPLEFGFITFDPLLTQLELAESIIFLLRTDVVISDKRTLTIEDIFSTATNKSPPPLTSNTPVFSRVAYLATELELFVNSPFVRIMQRNHPELLHKYDDTFARFTYSYLDPSIETIAGWCRVWTESTFGAIYRIRLKARTSTTGLHEHSDVLHRYRSATFSLLVSLVHQFGPVAWAAIQPVLHARQKALLFPTMDLPICIDSLSSLWDWVGGPDSGMNGDLKFDLSKLTRNRES